MDIRRAPLAGRTVIVTRPGDRAGPMVHRLTGLGARVLVHPSVEIALPVDDGPLLLAAERLGSFDWVVFTSANGVRALVGALLKIGHDPSALGPVRCAVVGAATAGAVEEVGWRVHLTPEDFTAEGLLHAFERRGLGGEGSRVLLPLAEAARDALCEGLRGLGARVTQVVAYRSVAPSVETTAEVRSALEQGAVDALTFTSPSTAANFLRAVGPAALLAPVVAIGPVTAEAAAGLGYRVQAVAPIHTAEALVESVVHLLA